MTPKEMYEAMHNGEVLDDEDGNTCFFDLDHKDGPYVFRFNGGETTQMCGGWMRLRWHIQKKPTMRWMTEMEVLGFISNTPGMFVRNEEWPGSSKELATDYTKVCSKSPANFEYCIIDLDGKQSEWRKFEKPVTE